MPKYVSKPTSRSESNYVVHQVCNKAAENIMDLLGVYRKLYSLRYVPVTIIQVIFSAGTVSLLSAVHATSGLRLAQRSLSDSIAQVQLCMQYLGEIGHSWNCANNIAEILDNLLRERLKPGLEMKSIGPKRRRDSDAKATASTNEPSVSNKIGDRSPVKPIPMNRPAKAQPPTAGSAPLSSSPVQYFGEPSTSRNDIGSSDPQFGSLPSYVKSVMGEADTTDAYGTGIAGADDGFATFGTGMPGGFTFAPYPVLVFGEPDPAGVDNQPESEPPGSEQYVLQWTPEDAAAIEHYFSTTLNASNAPS
jgi:hypothetical protein